MPLEATFACFAGCEERYSLTEVIYRCRSCGALLDVAHNMAALAETSGPEWRELFDRRYRSPFLPEGSGVWGKREWVLPQIDTNHIVSLGEGGSHLFDARRLGESVGIPELLVKLCGNGHTGSFKDLGMTVLVSAVVSMRAQGVPIRAVACASTGDTSAALAAYCAKAGIPSVVFLPRGKVSTAQLVQPLANGSLVLALDTDFDGCMRVVQQITSDGSIYLANSMNPLRLEGQKTAAIEIAQQFGWRVPDFVVIPSGNLGNVYAFGRGFQWLNRFGLTDRVPRLVCAQSEAANPLYRSFKNGFASYEAIVAKNTEASAIRIGDPVSYDRAVRILRETDGLVEQASEQELADAAAQGDRIGLYNDPHTGVALACAIKLAKSGVIKPHHRVVVVSTAHGLKFTEHKVKYHEGHLFDNPGQFQNQPVLIPADPKSVEKVLNERLGDS
ncbi:MAG: threonine synthase [Myxococcales bacterium]|nr:threonine synthase [Myxococcales bacterium]